MKHWLYYILFLLTAVVFVSCADEDNSDQYDDEPLQISVNAGWQCGRSISTSRAFIDPVGKVDDYLNSLQFPDTLYPKELHITISSGSVDIDDVFPKTEKFPREYIVKQTFSENDNYETQKYIAYHDVYSLKAYKEGGEKEKKPFYSKSQIQKLSVLAKTLHQDYTGTGKIPQPWNDGAIHTFGTIDHMTTGGAACAVYDPLFHGRYRIERNHLFLDLGHATALLRLHFKVDKDYDKIRKIVLRSVSIQKGDDASTKLTFDAIADNTAFSTIDNAPGFLLTTEENTASKLVAYCYMKPSHDYNGDPLSWANDNPAAISKGTPLTFKCTYDIYENDIITNITKGTLNTDLSAHCTRRSVTATNTTTLRMVFNSSAVEIKAGHYYDLMITINPDYLYVLSEHDNKHLTIQ